MDQITFENFLLGRCSAEEREAVEAWFMRHIDSDEVDSACLQMLGRMSAYHDRQQAMESYKELRKRLGLKHRSPWVGRIVRGAVAASVLALAGAASYHIGSNNAPAAQLPDLAQIASPLHGSLTAHLPDSSTIVLRPGSRIVYDRNSFRSHRDLMLFGDAYFEVAEDKSNAFTIRCQGAAIEVLGTRFDVHSHDDDDEFEVALYDGSVKLSSAFNSHSDTLMLRPGEIAKVDKITGALSTMKIDGLDSSTDESSLIFIDRPLHDIVNVLRRRTGTNIVLVNPHLSDVTFFAIFNGDESADRILATLALSEPMTITRTDSNTIEIR